MIELPVCRWRGNMIGPFYACSSPKLIVPPTGVPPHVCGMCPYVDHAENGASPNRITEPCAHLGEQYGETVCPTCSGGIRLKVFVCAVHGYCTLGRKAGAMALCVSCKDYKAGKEHG